MSWALTPMRRPRRSNGASWLARWSATSPGPAVAAPARPHHYLPAPLTAFIGRAAELDQIVEQLRERTYRLGDNHRRWRVGKTRPALQAAQQLLGGEPAG